MDRFSRYLIRVVFHVRVDVVRGIGCCSVGDGDAELAGALESWAADGLRCLSW